MKVCSCTPGRWPKGFDNIGLAARVGGPHAAAGEPDDFKKMFKV